MAKQDPKISVIVPVYNVAGFLAKCIESILAQDEPDFELLLIDDGSTDGSAQICDHYASRDARVAVVHKENGGVSSARNLGISLAKADWVCFVDSDDWVETGYLSHMLACADDERTVVYANLVHDYAGERHSAVCFDYEESTSCDLNEEGAADFIARNRILESGYPYSKIFSKKTLEKGLFFNERVSFHEDHIFVLNYLLSASRVTLSSCPDYHYMHRPAVRSLSKRRHLPANMLLASAELLKALEAVMERFPLEDAAYVRKIYTLLGLNQLVRAALDADRQEIGMVGDAIRSRRKLFQRYYSPNHSYVKLIPFLFFHRLDRIVLWISRLSGKRI